MDTAFVKARGVNLGGLHAGAGIPERRHAADRRISRAVRGQLPTIVGEWSLGMAGHAVASLGNAYERDVAMRALGALQLLVMERCAGWYFWSYKLDHDLMPAWDFRACVNRGWLPSRLMPAAPPKAS